MNAFILLFQPGPDSVGIFAISQRCNGVAARACGLVSLEPMKVKELLCSTLRQAQKIVLPIFLFSSNFQFYLQIVEILKDRPSWFRDCRSLEVFTMFPAGNGGTVELIYMQVKSCFCGSFFSFSISVFFFFKTNYI